MTTAPDPIRRTLRHRVRRWAFLALLTYLAIVLMFWFLERRLVFRPSSAEEVWL